MAASSTSRIKKINFFGPQYMSHRSLWTISEPNGTQATACRDSFCLLVSYRPLARLRRESTHSLQSSHQRSPRLIAGIASTGQSHTYWPEAHRARCIQCIQTSAVLQGGQAPARPTAAQTSSLEHEHPLRTCSHCTKSCGNRGHTYTPHSRRALREARNRRAQHAGRRNTTRKRPSVHQKTTQRGA